MTKESLCRDVFPRCGSWSRLMFCFILYTNIILLYYIILLE